MILMISLFVIFLFAIIRLPDAKYNILFFLVGLLFGIGVILMGWHRPTIILGFFTLNKEWNPTFLFGIVPMLLLCGLGAKLIEKRE